MVSLSDMNMRVSTKAATFGRQLSALPIPLSLSELKGAVYASLDKFGVDAETVLGVETEHRAHKQSYIPFEPREVVDLLVDSPLHRNLFAHSGTAQMFREFAHRMGKVNRISVAMENGGVLDTYQAFNPDQGDYKIDKTVLDAEFVRFKEQLGVLLAAAGFEPITPKDMEKALATKSSDGVNVRPPPKGQFEYLMFKRGETMIENVYRKWLRCYRRQVSKDAAYVQLLVMYRLVRQAEASVADGFLVRRYQEFDATRWHLKIYSNIPKGDIDMLVPNVSVIMGLYDIGMASAAIFAALGSTIYQLVATKTFGSFNTNQDAAITGVGIVAPLLVALAIVVDFIKRWLEFKAELYKLIANNLVASNDAALEVLIAETAKQEQMEALLAWFFLWRASYTYNSPWLTEQQLDAEAESFLKDEKQKEDGLGSTVDFNVTFGVQKLKQLGIVSASAHPTGEFLRSADLPKAMDAVRYHNVATKLHSKMDNADKRFHTDARYYELHPGAPPLAPLPTGTLRQSMAYTSAATLDPGRRATYAAGGVPFTGPPMLRSIWAGQL